MRERSLILTTGVNAVFTTVLLFSLFLLFRGHNQPGGGFVGGLVAGCALVLRYVEGGAVAARRTLPLTAPQLMGSGLVLAAVTGLVPLLLDDAYLESSKRVVDVPVLGDVAVVSALAFDVGVYLVVLGVVLTVLDVLGKEERS